MPTKFVTNPRRNPLHLAHPGHFRQGQVVRLRGARKRYVIATDVDPEVFGYHLVALSGGEVGSAPSGIRASDMELDANQDVSFSGAQAKKLQQKYRRASTMHQEHQRSLVSRRNPAAPPDAVFYATTRGGRYQIVVTPAGEHNGEKFYDLEEFTSGSSSARGYNNLEGLRSRIPNTLHYAKAWDGINYEVKVDTLGLAKKSNPRRNPDAATPRAFLSVLRSKLTQHDVKLSAKQPNMYRLGHYLAAAERVEKDMGKSLDSTSPAALEKLRQSLHKRFEMPFAPASAVERQIDAYLAKGTMPSLVRKNPRHADTQRLKALRDIERKGYTRRLGKMAGLPSRPPRHDGSEESLKTAGRWWQEEFLPRYIAEEVRHKRAEGFIGAKELHRRKRTNPPTGFRIAGPAVKTMSESLRISKADAQRLKDMMDTGAPRILQAADKMMNGHGVERISGVGGGLMYVNMGDTYDTTLIYDYKTNRFVVSSWGDIVERQPRRFAD